MTMRAVFPPGEAREDWTIIRAFSGHLGESLPFDNAMELRAKIYEVAPQLANIGEVEKADTGELIKLARGGIKVRPEPFGAAIEDFYLTNAIARASMVMNEMSTLRQELKASGGEGSGNA
jgi:NADH-quinone oxidoreductase subunit G